MPLRAVVLVVGLLVVVTVLSDAFETIVLPRRVTRRLRLARVFLRSLWSAWSLLARRARTASGRENMLSYFGPLALLLLIGTWAVGLVFGFAAVQWGLGSKLAGPGSTGGFWTDVYMSGTTLFTLGLGDVAPTSVAARTVTVVEAGTGFGFLALVIGYLPVLYQAFSRREVNISLLDARAGSPPSAVELARRNHQTLDSAALRQFLGDWERWSAELLESHLSYPILAYFRSQHDSESWLGALTTILDASALGMIVLDVESPEAGHQAELTFAMARHAAVDLSQIFDARPRPPAPDRLPHAGFLSLSSILETAGFVGLDAAAEARLRDLRELYEPYVNALSGELLLPLPPWLPPPDALDDWQSSPWDSPHW